jgi:hypothetical protein
MQNYPHFRIAEIPAGDRGDDLGTVFIGGILRGSSSGRGNADAYSR